jgi:hypothetical protein
MPCGSGDIAGLGSSRQHRFDSRRLHSVRLQALRGPGGVVFPDAEGEAGGEHAGTREARTVSGSGAEEERTPRRRQPPWRYSRRLHSEGSQTQRAFGGSTLTAGGTTGSGASWEPPGPSVCVSGASSPSRSAALVGYRVRHARESSGRRRVLEDGGNLVGSSTRNPASADTHRDYVGSAGTATDPSPRRAGPRSPAPRGTAGSSRDRPSRR